MQPGPAGGQCCLSSLLAELAQAMEVKLGPCLPTPCQVL